ncbi:alpha/beta fold hydrolase [Gordonia sp. (in: high G+C Gram-positive bacteria)]|uniref:alpha/beta fold hydrolase n=1 Tax=Gordonia sp. (in: high G+C Gram-positive bacteria) TaxID=84139 RepID=UPI0039E6A391
MTPPFRYADVRGARLAYNSTGTGSPVIWAHGMNSAAYTQESAGQFDWRPVSAEHRLIRYDARGHGRSSGGTDPLEYTWYELGQDLLGLIEAVQPPVGPRVDAMGSSMGSATILSAVLTRRDRFRRLVLCNPPTFWETRRPTNGVRMGSAQLVQDEGIAALAKLSVDVPASPALADGKRNITPIMCTREVLPAVFRGAAQTDLPPRDQLATIIQPTLILSWTGDPTHPVSSGEILAEALPNAELHVADTPTDHATWGQLAADFLR